MKSGFGEKLAFDIGELQGNAKAFVENL